MCFGFHQIHISVSSILLPLGFSYSFPRLWISAVFLPRLSACFDLSQQPSILAVGTADWWAQVESNHRPHAYQACALTFWAMSPCYLHNHRYRLIRRSVSLNLYGFGFSTDGGDEGIRTLDPLLAGQVLSQLSYTPIFEVSNSPWKSNNNFLKTESCLRRLFCFFVSYEKSYFNSSCSP